MTALHTVDWLIVAAYFVLVFGIAWMASRASCLYSTG